MQVGRWCRIDAATALLPEVDGPAEMVILMAAVDAELVIVNPGPTAHCIKLTEAGLKACRAAPEAQDHRTR